MTLGAEARTPPVTDIKNRARPRPSQWWITLMLAFLITACYVPLYRGLVGLYHQGLPFWWSGRCCVAPQEGSLQIPSLPSKQFFSLFLFICLSALLGAYRWWVRLTGYAPLSPCLYPARPPVLQSAYLITFLERIYRSNASWWKTPQLKVSYTIESRLWSLIVCGMKHYMRGTPSHAMKIYFLVNHNEREQAE